MEIEQRKQRGSELLNNMLGTEQAHAMRQRWQDICPQFEEYVLEFVAGEIWSRPGLDLRTRSLVTIATLASLGRPLALELNLRMAIKNGASQRDIVETLLHIAPYAGFPACWEGLAMAHKIFAEA
ncbi:MAG: 4-carboxymuconolactone decarboxylase [Planctomycetes bacterium]|nr:4-carboxymuconolactone decarboxylase [Planctomycetota bacterium]